MGGILAAAIVILAAYRWYQFVTRQT